MSDCVFIARLFLISGGVLAVIGMILWFTLPIPAMFPPYLVTALLALGYGVVWNCRRGAPRVVKAEVPAEVKPEAKSETKLDAKPEAKAEAKTEIKPEVKPEAKPAAPKAEAPKTDAPKKETLKPEAAKP